jgi:hypothetical protein
MLAISSGDVIKCPIPIVQFPRLHALIADQLGLDLGSGRFVHLPTHRPEISEELLRCSLGWRSGGSGGHWLPDRSLEPLTGLFLPPLHELRERGDLLLG